MVVKRPGISQSPVLCALVLAPPDPAAFSGVFSSVESRKKKFLNTASQRAQAGISFEAMPFGRLFSWIASESNRCSPVRRSDARSKIAQRISCALHRENAHAILKRAPEQTGSHCFSLALSLLSESGHD